MESSPSGIMSFEVAQTFFVRVIMVVNDTFEAAQRSSVRNCAARPCQGGAPAYFKIAVTNLDGFWAAGLDDVMRRLVASYPTIMKDFTGCMVEYIKLRHGRDAKGKRVRIKLSTPLSIADLKSFCMFYIDEVCSHRLIREDPYVWFRDVKVQRPVLEECFRQALGRLSDSIVLFINKRKRIVPTPAYALPMQIEEAEPEPELAPPAPIFEAAPMPPPEAAPLPEPTPPAPGIPNFLASQELLDLARGAVNASQSYVPPAAPPAAPAAPPAWAPPAAPAAPPAWAPPAALDPTHSGSILSSTRIFNATMPLGGDEEEEEEFDEDDFECFG